MSTKICAECRWCSRSKPGMLLCGSPHLPIDIVDGEPQWAACKWQRYDAHDGCGKNGNWHEPRTAWQRILRPWGPI